MNAKFIFQPYDDGTDMRDYFKSSLNDNSIKNIDITVAWAKRSGLCLFENEIKSFRNRGGKIRIIVGISQGGATIQGLKMCLDLFDQVYIFHDASRTFHPKVFISYGEDIVKILIGSHNLTGGGAIHNYEAGIIFVCDLSNESDIEFYRSTLNYFNRLLSDTHICILMDEKLLSSIISNPIYQIKDEDAPTKSTLPLTTKDNLETYKTNTTENSLFTKSKYNLRSIQQKTLHSHQNKKPSEIIQKMDTTENSQKNQILKRWFKKLSSADAQRPNSGTNPTGHLTLTKNNFEIEHSSYFRRDFFSSEYWYQIPASRNRERTQIKAHVIINKSDLGIMDFEIDHNPDFESGQGNRTSTLRWGSLNEYFRENNLVNHFISLEKTTSGIYILTISEHPKGEFIK